MENKWYTSIIGQPQYSGDQLIVIIKLFLIMDPVGRTLKNELLRAKYSDNLKYSTSSSAKSVSIISRRPAKIATSLVPGRQETMTVADAEPSPFHYFGNLRCIVYLGEGGQGRSDTL